MPVRVCFRDGVDRRYRYRPIIQLEPGNSTRPRTRESQSGTNTLGPLGGFLQFDLPTAISRISGVESSVGVGGTAEGERMRSDV